MLAAFHTAVETYQSPAERSIEEWSERAGQAHVEEDELVIDPEFFLTLGEVHPAVEHVEVLQKRGRAHNELTEFRYDVVVHVGHGASATSGHSARLEWETEQLSVESLEGLRGRLEAESDALVVTTVPNARVSRTRMGSRPWRTFELGAAKSTASTLRICGRWATRWTGWWR